MDMKQLGYYLSLAETKSFAKSADLLFISRQGLSKSISMLEKELGVVLFRRTSAGVELTESGALFHPYALRLMDEYNAAIKTLQEHTDTQKPHIHFAAQHGFFANISMDMIDSFFDQHPNMRYSSESFLDDELIQCFSRGDFAFAVTTDPIYRSQYRYDLLFRNYRCIVVNKQHPLAAKQYIHTTDLKNIPVVTCASGFFDYPWLIKLCNEYGFQPNTIPVRDSLTALQYAQSGKIPTLSVYNISNTEPENKNLCYLFWAEDELEKTGFDINVITVKGKPVPRYNCQFIKHMQHYCQQQLEKIDYYPFVR